MQSFAKPSLVLIFVFTIPLLWGSDETSHIGRVYQITHGYIFSHAVHDKTSYSSYGFGGTIPATLRSVVDYVNIDFNVNNNQHISGVKWVDHPEDYDRFAALPLSGPEVQYNFSNTAIYSPVSYIPSILGLKLAEIGRLHIGPAIYLTRVFDLLFYVAVVAYALYCLRELRAKWLIFVTALIPSAVFQAATINADAVTNALAFVVVGLTMKAMLIRRTLGRAEFIGLLVCTFLLPVVKPSYLFISFLPLIVPLRSVPWQRYNQWMIPAALLLGLVAYSLWQYKTRYLSNAVKYIIAGVVPWWQNIDSAGQIHYVVHHPFAFALAFIRSLLINDNFYFNGLFGRLGFSFVQVPALSILSSLTAIIGSILTAETFSRTKKGIGLLGGVFIFSLLAVFGTCYLTISAVGMSTIEGVQGRYLLPVVPVLLFGLVYACRVRLHSEKPAINQYAGLTICSFAIVGLLVSALKYYYITWG
jgi:uncharacterized membrane protein